MNPKPTLVRVWTVAGILSLVLAMVPPVPGLMPPALAAPTGPVINEFSASTTGTDVEYLEVYGDPETDYSAYTILEIEGDVGASAGTIDEVVAVGTTDAAGFWLGNLPANALENGTISLLLVEGFSGAAGTDLDTDNDGAFDATPWTAVVDVVAVNDGDAGDLTYGVPALGPNYDEMSSFAPGGASRLPDGQDTDAATDWVRNDFDLAGIPGFTGTPEVGEALNTPGAPNEVVLPPPPPAGATLVINEIDYDQPGTDTAEFIEIKNIGDDTVSLSTIQLVLVNGTGGGAAIYVTISLPAISLVAGDYYVVCGDAANVPNCDLDVSPDTNLIQNGAPDAVGLLENGSLIDTVSYEGDSGAPYTEGSGAGLVDDPNLDYAGISRLPDGVDTDVNNVDLSLRCRTPGEQNTSQDTNCPPPSPAPAALVINEIDYDQPGTDTAEFVEIKNTGDNPVDLSTIQVILVNGSGGGAAIYGTIPLPAVSLAAGDYFVVCGSVATVPNCDLDVSPDTNLIQNGAPDAVGLRDGGTLIDAVSYEGDTGAPYTEGSGSGLEDPGADGSISRCPDGFDSDQNNSDFTFGDRTPGGPNDCEPPPPPEACGDPITPIFAIQGNGLASPLVGIEVVTEGIVVGDFQDNTQPDNGDLSGFYLQDATGDGDTATSDGIFVYAPGSQDVAAGDRVRVRGTVAEYFDLTEVTGVSLVLPCGTTGSVAPTTLTLPVTALSDFEAYEGMLVTVPQPLYISEYFNFDRFGEIVLTTERQFQPTAIEEPGSSEAAAVAAANTLGRITLDDGRGSQNPDPAIHPNGAIFDLTNRFRGGDTVQNVTGVLDYSFGLYRIQPTQGADYFADNPRPTAPEDSGGGLTVASFNVLNYFTTVDTGAFICGPSGDMECRGADDAEELERQRNKIIDALVRMDADVVGLIEIQNDAFESTADLVAGLNDALGAGTYAYIGTGFIGTDAIKQAFVYQIASVSPVGPFALLDASVDPRFDDDRNRPALAQTFQDNDTGGVFTVVVNHLKSKGSPCDDVGDPDTGDGSGNCSLTRTAAAQALVDWLATDPTGSGSPDVLIMGDLNSYDKEDPIDAILVGADDAEGTSDDWTDLVRFYQGEYAYSYVFDGQLGYLDHGLASAEMVSKVTGTTIWHINADEPDLLDYDTSFKQPAQDALYEANAYRSSDHDPVIVGLNVCEMTPPTLSVELSPNSLWPANHKYVDVTATVTAVDNWDAYPQITLISVTSNEADDGLGDGDTANDILVVDELHFQMRAERSGTGEGRTYTVTYQATDACGNSVQASASVTVPKSQSKK